MTSLDEPRHKGPKVRTRTSFEEIATLAAGLGILIFLLVYFVVMPVLG